MSEAHKDQPSPSGAIASYIHAGGRIGVLIEMSCESDFVAKTDDFKELLHDLAMHIAATDPKFIRKEDVTPEAIEKEKDIYRAQAARTAKSPDVIEKIVEGKMNKFYEEVCLYEQPFIKDQSVSVSDLVAEKICRMGENIAVRRFARFKVGASCSYDSANRDYPPENEDGPGVAVKRPSGPKHGGGGAAAKPEPV